MYICTPIIEIEFALNAFSEIRIRQMAKSICIKESQIEKIMRKDIHPEDYRFVVFKDMSNEYAFLSRSTAASNETIEWEDGNEYPLIKLEISYKSHPYFTGKMQFVDTAGRVDKFKKRYSKFDKKK